jgi:hypothetical protein
VERRLLALPVGGKGEAGPDIFTSGWASMFAIRAARRRAGKTQRLPQRRETMTGSDAGIQVGGGSVRV